MPYVTQVLGADGGPVVAASDCMKTVPDLIARWVPQPYIVLGTDGFGRSDTREALRAHFEIDAAEHRRGRPRRARPARRLRPAAAAASRSATSASTRTARTR